MIETFQLTIDQSKLTKSINRQIQTNSAIETVVLGKVAISDSAMLVIDEFVERSCAAGIEGLRKEFANLKGFIPPNFHHNQCLANFNRNRYKDVVCLDSTRVVLTLNVPPETDYIHANWIKLWGVDHVFIATQGPLESTVGDFWRMIYQEEAKTILMLAKTVEDNKQKCVQYWPEKDGSRRKHGCMYVSNKKVEKDDKFTKNTIEVIPEGSANSVILKLIQMTDWPDRGVPKSGMSVLRMLKLIEPNGPCVVHCSAGIGRTGTVILVETCLQRLWKGYRLNVRFFFDFKCDHLCLIIE
ncbi:unnamed protein product [Thelazia callipaeda]|uniref:Protein-tyrosine phosphatase n=1 Tax=Thelazia callipaeda TaxID=103827 RepID=A0A0N5D3J2_THECL|nr:unnamed protein product [Thelazia callipaeda]